MPSLPPAPRPPVAVLSPASVQLLRSLGVWRHVSPPLSSAAFSSLQVWDAAPSARGGGGAHLRLDAHQIAHEALGFCVESELLRAAVVRELFLAAQQQRPGAGGAEMVAGRVAAATLPPPAAGDALAFEELELACGRLMRARLVVAADGGPDGGSALRHLAGMRAAGQTLPGLAAVAGVVGPPAGGRPNAHSAWLRFLPEGCLALLPSRDACSVALWTTGAAAAARLAAAPPAEFAAAVNAALASGSTQATGSLGFLPRSEFRAPPEVAAAPGAPPPVTFPVALRHAGSYVRPRVALIGAAAAVVPPLLGQGVNGGLGDARALAAAVGAAAAAGQDVGSVLALQEGYEAHRRRANGATVAAAEALAVGFAPQRGPLAALRGLGLGLINALPVTRGTLMRYAMFGT